MFNIRNYDIDFHVKSGSSYVYYLKKNNEIKYVAKHLYYKAKEKFEKETFCLDILEKYKYFPKIIYRNKNNNYFVMNYCGKLVNKKNLPKNWNEQIKEIKKILYDNDIAHGDIKSENICVNNNTIILIDFGNIRFKKDKYFESKSYEEYVFRQHSKLDVIMNNLS